MTNIKDNLFSLGVNRPQKSGDQDQETVREIFSLLEFWSEEPLICFQNPQLGHHQYSKILEQDVNSSM